MTSRHCLLQRNQTMSNSPWAQEDCPSQPPLLLRRNQVIALAPGIWAEVLYATIIMALRYPFVPIFFLSPSCAKTKQRSILHTTSKPNCFLISYFLNPFIKLKQYLLHAHYIPGTVSSYIYILVNLWALEFFPHFIWLFQKPPLGFINSLDFLFSNSLHLSLTLLFPCSSFP